MEPPGIGSQFRKSIRNIGLRTSRIHHSGLLDILGSSRFRTELVPTQLTYGASSEKASAKG